MKKDKLERIDSENLAKIGLAPTHNCTRNPGSATRSNHRFMSSGFKNVILVWCGVVHKTT